MNERNSLWSKVAHVCERNYEECREALETFLSSMCPDRSECEEKIAVPGRRAHYTWIERIIESGVPDGRARLILYVISRYLVNVKRLSVEEAHEIIKLFIQASCEKHNQCSKIYDSWIRNVLVHVKEGGWKPWSLERIKTNDPELYQIITSILDTRKS